MQRPYFFLAYWFILTSHLSLQSFPFLFIPPPNNGLRWKLVRPPAPLPLRAGPALSSQPFALSLSAPATVIRPQAGTCHLVMLPDLSRELWPGGTQPPERLVGAGGLLGPGQVGGAPSEAEVKPNTDCSGWDGWPGQQVLSPGQWALQAGQGQEVACWASLCLQGRLPPLLVGGGSKS